jgi:hypothetical protein
MQRPETFAPALEQIKASRVNVIVAIVAANPNPTFFALAEECHLFDDGYVWLTTDSLTTAAVSRAPLDVAPLNHSTEAAEAQPSSVVNENARRLNGVLNFYASAHTELTRALPRCIHSAQRTFTAYSTVPSHSIHTADSARSRLSHVCMRELQVGTRDTPLRQLLSRAHLANWHLVHERRPQRSR